MKSRHGWKEGTKIEARLTGDSQKKDANNKLSKYYVT